MALRTIAQGQRAPRDLALDATHVYWLNQGSGSIACAPKRGGDVVVLASGQVKPWRIAVGDEYVFWVCEQADGGLRRVGKRGGATTVLADVEHAVSVAVHRGDVFCLTATGRVLKTPAAGGATQTLAITDAKPWRLAVDASHAYWTNANGFVMRVSTRGGEPEVIATGQGDPRVVVMDQESVFWSTTSGAVRATRKSGGDVETRVDHAGARGLAVDEHNLILTDCNGGAVLRAPKRGGKATTIARGVEYPLNVVSDGRAAYFTCFTGGAVMAVDL